MASRWTHHPRSSSRSSNNYTTSSDPPLMSGTSARVKRQGSSDHSIPPPVFPEPLPLDDNCARYVLSVMILFLRQTASPDPPLVLKNAFSDLTFRDFEPTNMAWVTEDTADTPPVSVSNHSRTQELRSQSSSNSVRSSKLSLSSTIQLPASKTTYEKTHMSLVKSSLPVNNLIAKYTGRIVFHISASNWNVVYDRLRNKIHLLATNPEGNPDLTDLLLMAHSALDRQRLVQLLIGMLIDCVSLSPADIKSELSSLLVSMGRHNQIAVAIPLRTAVWNWINTFPAEFNEAIRSRGKTEGAPERVFDILYAMNPSNDERIFWPTLAILNCTTSDRLSSDFQLSYSGPAKIASKSSRKVFFSAQLRNRKTSSFFS